MSVVNYKLYLDLGSTFFTNYVNINNKLDLLPI